jgi:hypothetical protein
MTTQSNVCACAACTGSECTCGCQNATGRPAASCQCGEVCNCGPTCTCEGCQHANAKPAGEPVMHGDTGLLAVVGSVCMSGPFAFFLVFERLRLTPPAATSWR